VFEVTKNVAILKFLCFTLFIKVPWADLTWDCTQLNLVAAFKILTHFSLYLGRHDTLHNDIQHNDIQHNDIQHNDIQHNDIQHNDIQHNDIQHNDIQHNNK
jgi:hypothetical protein